MATKEQTYKAQLEKLGVYDEAFDSAIHELCILEREMSRARKQLKAKAGDGQAPSLTDPLYGVIRQINSAVLAYRDSLGLTPKGLRKLKGNLYEPKSMTPARDTVLSLIQSKHEARKSAPPA